MIVTTCIDKLQRGLGLSDRLLDILPINLELLIFLDLLHVKVDDQSTSARESVIV